MALRALVHPALVRPALVGPWALMGPGADGPYIYKGGDLHQINHPPPYSQIYMYMFQDLGKVEGSVLVAGNS